MLDIEKLILEKTKYEGSDIEKSVSASSIESPLLQQYYRFIYGSEDEQNGVIQTEFNDASFGTVFHKGMETLFDGINDVIVEKRFERELPNGWTVTAKPDLIDFSSQATDGDISIDDFKTGKNYSRKMMMKDMTSHSYYIQLCTGKFVANKYISGIINKGRIHWFMKDAKQIDRGKLVKEPVYICDEFELFSDEYMEKYLIEKTDILWDAIQSGQEPPECEDLWLRKLSDGTVIKSRCEFYCSYKSVCKYYKGLNVAQEANNW